MTQSEAIAHIRNVASNNYDVTEDILVSRSVKVTDGVADKGFLVTSIPFGGNYAPSAAFIPSSDTVSCEACELLLS